MSCSMVTSQASPQRAGPQRAPSNSATQTGSRRNGSPEAHLQRSIGNRAVNNLLRPQSQSRLADQLMRMPANEAGETAVENPTTLAILRIICPECESENETIQAKPAAGSLSPLNADMVSDIETAKAGGEPLSH